MQSSILVVAIMLDVDSKNMAKIQSYGMVSIRLNSNKKENKNEKNQNSKMKIMKSRIRKSIRYTVNIYELLFIIAVYISGDKYS